MNKKKMVFENAENKFIKITEENGIEICKINIEADSVSEIKKLNDYILEKIKEFDFDLSFENLDEDNTVNKIISEMIILLNKEIKEVRDDIESIKIFK